jgi:hypothetical protein
LFRKKLNLSTYEHAQTVSDYEADLMKELAEIIYDKVINWLKEKYPVLIKSLFTKKRGVISPFFCH